MGFKTIKKNAGTDFGAGAFCDPMALTEEAWREACDEIGVLAHFYNWRTTAGSEPTPPDVTHALGAIFGPSGLRSTASALLSIQMLLGLLGVLEVVQVSVFSAKEFGAALSSGVTRKEARDLFSPDAMRNLYKRGVLADVMREAIKPCTKKPAAKVEA